MAKQRIVPNETEAGILRTLANGYQIRVINGRVTVGTSRVVTNTDYRALINKGWITFQSVKHSPAQEPVRIYVGTKRGREALSLLPPLQTVKVEVSSIDTTRFGVVKPAPKGK